MGVIFGFDRVGRVKGLVFAFKAAAPPQNLVPHALRERDLRDLPDMRRILRARIFDLFLFLDHIDRLNLVLKPFIEKSGSLSPMLQELSPGRSFLGRRRYNIFLRKHGQGLIANVPSLLQSNQLIFQLVVLQHQLVRECFQVAEADFELHGVLVPVFVGLLFQIVQI